MILIRLLLLLLLLSVIIVIIIQFNSYLFCANSTAQGPITKLARVEEVNKHTQSTRTKQGKIIITIRIIIIIVIITIHSWFTCWTQRPNQLQRQKQILLYFHATKWIIIIIIIIICDILKIVRNKRFRIYRDSILWPPAHGPSALTGCIGRMFVLV
jgi:H+/gluconate symporter-like permease